MRYGAALDTRAALLREVTRWRARGGEASVLTAGAAAGVSRQDTQGWLDARTVPLEAGAVYYVTAPIAALVIQAARTIPLDWRLRPPDVPAPAAFWYLEAAPDHPAGRLRCWTWATAGPAAGPETWRVLLVSAWVEPTRGGTLRPGWPVEWRIGGSLREALTLQEGGDGANAEQGTTLRLAASTLAFLGQDLLRTMPVAPDRAARRRLEREGQAVPEVRVVYLRQPKRLPDAAVADPVDWTCRWWVTGHWRDQPCGPGRADRRPTWIPPHVKGPEDKPLRPPRDTLFAVVR